VVVAELVLLLQKQELITHQATVLREEQDARNKKSQTIVMNISQQAHST
jgi:hypothetical protein